MDPSILYLLYTYLINGIHKSLDLFAGHPGSALRGFAGALHDVPLAEASVGQQGSSLRGKEALFKDMI